MNPQVAIHQLPKGYFERIADMAFSRLTVLVRDVNMGESAVAAYQPGRILRERAFVEASDRCHGRPATTHRITILTNQMLPVEHIDDDPEACSWGMHVARQDGRFKVIDVWSCGDRTQIVLLHLPQNDNWRLFEGAGLSQERELAELARVQFRRACMAPIELAVATDRWLARCSWPIGLTNDGAAQELEEPVESRLRPIAGLDFRDIVGSLLYIADSRHLLGLESHEQVDESYGGCVGYGYLDELEGLSVRVMGSARIADGEVDVVHNVDDVDVTIRFDAFAGERAAVIADEHLVEFASRIEEVDRRHPALPAGMGEVRELREIDHLRFDTFPDDIQVLLVSEGHRREAVWARSRALCNGHVQATLLNEPTQDLGVHAGDPLDVEMRQGREGMVCLAVV